MIRRQAALAAVPESRRPQLVAELVGRLETLLAEAYPAQQGFERRTRWSAATRAQWNATADMRERCREARVDIIRGRDWGLVFDVSPQDLQHRVLWLRASILPPAIEWWRNRALDAGLLLGGIAGAALAYYWVRNGWQPQNPRAPLAVVGAGLMAGAALTLSVVNAARLYYQWRLAPDLRRADDLLARSWQSLSAHYAGLQALAPRRSPTLHQAAITIALSAVAALGYYGFWAIEPATTLSWLAMMAVGVTGAVAGFGAICFAVFTLSDYMGLEVGDWKFKAGD